MSLACLVKIRQMVGSGAVIGEASAGKLEDLSHLFCSTDLCRDVRVVLVQE